MSDSAGQATAVSIVVAIRRLGRTWYRLLFFLARHVGYITAPMRRQAFIHFCHWMVLTDVPDQHGGRTRLARPLLWFESNYDGDVTRYMDTFARTIPWRMRAAWMPTRGFPDMFPPEPFHRWTVDNAYEATHYWSAYPEATTKDVGRALRVEARVDELRRALVGSSAAEAERHWSTFLTATQRDL